MPMTKLCPIVDHRWLTADVVSLTLEAGEMAAAARAGQFVNIKCGEGLLLRRPISICDADEHLLRVVFQVKGEGTSWLAEQKVGQALDVLGPLGHGYEIPQGKVLVVGGGIGVPPMLYAAKCCREADACVGFRSKTNAILLKELGEVCGKVYVTSDDGSIGDHGFVNAQVKKALAADTYAAVFSCGPKIMLKTVYEAAKEAGVPCFVSLEERMGCGVGACLVCACSVGGHHKHVCKDGPVFNAQEVDW